MVMFNCIQNNSNKISRIYLRLAVFYPLSTGLAVILLRESLNFSGKHTAHAYLLASAFLIPLMQYLLVNQRIVDILFQKNQWVKPLSVVGIVSGLYALLMQSMVGFTRIKLSNSNLPSARPVASSAQMKNFDMKGCIIDKTKASNKIKMYLDDQGCADNQLLELVHSAQGNRSNTSDFPMSIINQWSIKSSGQE